MSTELGSGPIEDLIDELARVLHEPGEARELVLRAGFPPAYVPSFDAPGLFWSRVVRAAADGKTVSGVEAIVELAANAFPGNRVLAGYRSRPLVASKTPAPQPAGGSRHRTIKIDCPICDDSDATCTWDSDSDGASWTWITWQHACPHCGYAAKKITQWPYDHEDIECQLPGHRPSSNRDTRGGFDVNHALNTGVNESLISKQLPLLRRQLAELEQLDRETPVMEPVFISYTHADEAVVNTLCERFERDGLNYWRDHKDILAGDIIDRAISDGIQNSWIFLVILTPRSVNSPWVQRELDEALYESVTSGKVMIPIVAGGLGDQDIPARLRRLFFVDFNSGFEPAYARLLRSIKGHSARRKENA